MHPATGRRRVSDARREKNILCGIRRKTFYMKQDNDPKHHNGESKALQAQHGIELVAVHRRAANGNRSTDVAPGRGGHLVKQGKALPAYSPDINAPIEKIWWELQRCVLV